MLRRVIKNPSSSTISQSCGKDRISFTYPYSEEEIHFTAAQLHLLVPLSDTKLALLWTGRERHGREQVLRDCGRRTDCDINFVIGLSNRFREIPTESGDSCVSECVCVVFEDKTDRGRGAVTKTARLG